MVYIGVDKIKNYKEGQGDMAYLRECGYKVYIIVGGCGGT